MISHIEANSLQIAAAAVSPFFCRNNLVFLFFQSPCIGHHEVWLHLKYLCNQSCSEWGYLWLQMLRSRICLVEMNFKNLSVHICLSGLVYLYIHSVLCLYYPPPLKVYLPPLASPPLYICSPPVSPSLFCFLSYFDSKHTHIYVFILY